jgi:hypothetical protein
MLGRPKTLLNIPRQPPVGSTWIIQNIDTLELCKCSTTSQCDKDAVEALRKFSGNAPFFTAKIGSRHTQLTYLTFYCGSTFKICIDSTSTWKWLDITQDEADIKGLWYSEPGLTSEKLEDNIKLPEKDFQSIKDLTSLKNNL